MNSIYKVISSREYFIMHQMHEMKPKKQLYFFTKILIEIRLKKVNRTTIVQIKILKKLNLLKINMMRFFLVHSIDLFSNQNINLFKKLATQDS